MSPFDKGHLFVLLNDKRFGSVFLLVSYLVEEIGEWKYSIGHHQAVVPQLLLVVGGEGFVRGEDDAIYLIKAGEAAFWIKDKYHETSTKTGLTAIVIESEELDPASFMQEKTDAISI
jgi:hypothetical protein